MVDYGDADMINQILNDLTMIFKNANHNSFDNTIVFKPNIFNVRSQDRVPSSIISWNHKLLCPGHDAPSVRKKIMYCPRAKGRIDVHENPVLS